MLEQMSPTLQVQINPRLHLPPLPLQATLLVVGV